MVKGVVGVDNGEYATKMHWDIPAKVGKAWRAAELEGEECGPGEGWGSRFSHCILSPDVDLHLGVFHDAPEVSISLILMNMFQFIQPEDVVRLFGSVRLNST